jgi:putative Mg2+ transporter-C (MgtC) family protein
MGNGVELLTRLVVGTVLGAIIGYERRLHGRPAGLRTHLLVALASTTFMLVSTQFVSMEAGKAHHVWSLVEIVTSAE